MAVRIDGIEQGSAADRAGIVPGDRLLCIGGREIRDVLDYGFYAADAAFTLEIEKKSGETAVFQIEKDEYEDLGLLFDDFLLDNQHTCRNKCVFCFIDQMPQGMRETLYFKDDDERLSYLFGNYITLTNLSDREVDRIIEMHITPVNISVHTLNEKLRCEMMGNRFAGESLRHLYRLAEAGIEINCQIVACRDINDGEELKSTLEKLGKLYPAVTSVAVVPVGLTGFREGLCELEPYDKKSAAKTLEMIERFNREFRKKSSLGLFYPADEWYLLAGQEIPPIAFYDELQQLENGVGMLALLQDEFLRAMEDAEADDQKRAVDIITGEAAAPFIEELTGQLNPKFPGASVTVHMVKNKFFGGKITVAGLVTGGDIKKQIAPDVVTGERIAIPRSMLRSEGDLFLDDVSLDDLSAHFKKEIVPIADGYELFDAIMR